jgi:hypothetical protein
VQLHHRKKDFERISKPDIVRFTPEKVDAVEKFRQLRQKNLSKVISKINKSKLEPIKES